MQIRHFTTETETGSRKLSPRLLGMFVAKDTNRHFRAEKRSAQASAHPLSQAQGGNFLCVDCVCLLLEI